MKNLFKYIVVFSITLLLYSSSALAQSLEADLEAGSEIFINNCAVCHSGGYNSVNPVKTLQKIDLEAYEMDNISAITTQVKNGKNGMPAFGDKLSIEDINNVANYVLTQSQNGW